MKKYLLLFLVFIHTSVLLGQINILDEKNGFKSLKFGTSLEEFQIPQSELSEDYEMILFNTNNEDLKTVFDTKMDQLFLSFGNSKLKGIILVKNYSTYNGYNDAIYDIEKITEQFKRVLGKNNSAINNETGTGPVWEGDKVSLLLVLQAENIELQSDGRPLFRSNVKVMFLQNDEYQTPLSEGF